jgi:hypothetical protein
MQYGRRASRLSPGDRVAAGKGAVAAIERRPTAGPVVPSAYPPPHRFRSPFLGDGTPCRRQSRIRPERCQVAAAGHSLSFIIGRWRSARRDAPDAATCRHKRCALLHVRSRGGPRPSLVLQPCQQPAIIPRTPAPGDAVEDRAQLAPIRETCRPSRCRPTARFDRQTSSGMSPLVRAYRRCSGDRVDAKSDRHVLLVLTIRIGIGPFRRSGTIRDQSCVDVRFPEQPVD